jgi:glutamate-1-semialdehyde 2,1-aminomutase
MDYAVSAAATDSRWSQSESVVARGRSLLPDGVSSPVRTFSEVASPPLVIARGQGGRLWDVDGNEYVDFMLGLGPIILGHAHSVIASAVEHQSKAGTVFACSSEIEYELAEMILEALPFVDQLRFVCSGTEAAMTAVRLARTFTGRRTLVKFAGAYHGHSDAVLAGGSAKTPDSASDDSVVVCEYNNVDEIKEVMALRGREVAAIIVEPFACNMGLVLPTTEFMKALRDSCDACDALLIFDEVVTGFRVRFGSAQGLLDVTPDLITMGKVIGGGAPIGAYAGRREIMRLLDGIGGVFQGGTFAGNPLSMAAGAATLRVLRDGNVYERLEHLGTKLEVALQGRWPAGRQIVSNFTRVGSIASLMPTTSGALDSALYSKLHLELLRRGFLLPPSVDEALFLCDAHTDEDVLTLAAAVEEIVTSLSASETTTSRAVR